MTESKKPRGLRAALRNRVSNETVYRMPLRPVEETKPILAELRQAQNTATAGAFLKQKNPERAEEVDAVVAASEQAVEELQARYDACFYLIRFRPMPADEFDALVQLHPPKPEEVERDQEAGREPPLWNDETFYPELLERCAFDSELSAEEWAAELKGWSRAERKEVQSTALAANVKSYNAALSFD